MNIKGVSEMKLNKTEIDLLAQDVRNNINQTLDITKFTLTASCLLLGFAFSNIVNAGILTPVICLLPIPLIITAIEMIFNRRTNIMRKATYLRKYGGKQYRWELFLRGLRDEITNDKQSNVKNSKSSFTKTILIMLFVMCFICILSSIGFIVYDYACLDILEQSKICVKKFYKDPIVYISGAVAILIFIYSLIKWNKIETILMGGDYEKEVFEKWDIVESELKNNKSKDIGR